MRKIGLISFILASAIMISFLTGCGEKEKTFGQKITEGALTPIGDILSNPGRFEDKAVKIQGRVTDVCPAGGWFFLKDGTGTIYVNLHPSYFAIPQVRGSGAVAQGRVRKEGTQIEVIGEGVQLK